MPRTPMKPSKIVIEPVRARAIRGPHKTDPKSFYWRGEVHHNGTTNTLWTGWGTRKEVRERITDLIAAKGLDRLVAESNARRGDVTHIDTVEILMRAWIGWWLDDPEAKPSTVRGYRFAAKRVVAGLGDVRINRLDLTALERYRRATLKAWRSEKRAELAKVEQALLDAQERLEAVRGTEREPAAERGVGTLQSRLQALQRRVANPVLSTLALDLKALNAAWNWARERIDGFPNKRLPVKAVLPSKKEVREAIDDHRPSEADFWAVVGHLGGWARRAVLLLAATGARKSEIATARWEGFDPAEGTLAITDSKTGRREVALPPATVEMLVAERPDPARGRILSEVTVTTVQSGLPQHLRRACATAGVRYFSVQAIRRMVTDKLYSSGSDPSAAAAQLGHSVQVALEHYRRVGMAEKKRAVALAGLGAPPEKAKVVSLDERREKKSG